MFFDCTLLENKITTTAVRKIGIDFRKCIYAFNFTTITTTSLDARFRIYIADWEHKYISIIIEKKKPIGILY